MDSYIDITRLKAGHLMARKYFELWDKAATRVVTPHTEYVHYSILADSIDGHWFSVEQKDTTTLFPIAYYNGEFVRIYSVADGDRMAALRKALELVLKQVPYQHFRGWETTIHLIPLLLRHWLGHGIKPIPWDRLRNVDIYNRLNCLTLMRLCYPGIVSDKYAMSPGALEQMYREGKMVIEQEGILRTDRKPA